MLRYCGDGRWLPGVPARDLADVEASACGGAEMLVASGLYQVASETDGEIRRRDQRGNGREDAAGRQLGVPREE